jgi:hypothetical protein
MLAVVLPVSVSLNALPTTFSMLLNASPPEPVPLSRFTVTPALDDA